MFRSIINSTNAFPALKQLRSVFDKRTITLPISLSEPKRLQSTNPVNESKPNPSPNVKYSFYCSVDDPVK